MAVAVGIVGFLTNLAIALVGALVVWWLVRAIQVRRANPTVA
jgi:predicted lipid-binding transport protein (Tim44 family)